MVGYSPWGHRESDTTEHEKVGLKLNIQKTKIMAPGPITSWQIDGEIVDISQTVFGEEGVKVFFFL